MSDLTSLDDDIVDIDGYPTDAALALIGNWTSTPRALVEDLLDPIFTDYGTLTITPGEDSFHRDVISVSLATGGWSGNEDAVAELRGTTFWMLWWRTSRRGGAYEFEVPLDQWEHPMIAMPRPPRTPAAQPAETGPNLADHLASADPWTLAREYANAQAVLSRQRPGTYVHAAATAVAETLRPRVVRLLVPCSVPSCPHTGALTRSVPQIAAMTAAPRGLCAEHA